MSSSSSVSAFPVHPACDVDFNIMHKEIRGKVCLATRQKLGFERAVQTALIFEGGHQLHKYDTDKEELFEQESFFQYLFGVKEAGFWGIILPSSGTSILFCPKLHPDWAIWEGRIHPPSYFKDFYGVDECLFVEDIPQKLVELKVKELLILNGVNSDSGTAFKEVDFAVLGDLQKERITVTKDVIMRIISECRMIKTPLEIKVLKYVNDVSSAAHRYVMRNVKPGMMEYQLESLFLHYCSYHMHARAAAYTCICCTGENGAVLHYGGASNPLIRQIKDGDMCLLDMGTAHHGYVSDITCSFPANGKFTEDQKEIYLSVYAAQRAVEAACKPGVEWVDMHKLAERVILENLVKYDFLRGDVAEMHEMRISAYFMPHGLGHLMGLDVHDVGGFSDGRSRIQQPSLKSLRMNRKLEAGMVLTNEPGIYFIGVLLLKALDDESIKHYFNREKILKFLDFGGVRLEDDVLITETGCETLTKVPRTIPEVEAQMALPETTFPIADSDKEILERKAA